MLASWQLKQSSPPNKQDQPPLGGVLYETLQSAHLLRRVCALPWLGTMPGAAHPKTRGSMIHSPDVQRVSAMNPACPPKVQSFVARGSQADHIEEATLFERKSLSITVFTS